MSRELLLYSFFTIIPSMAKPKNLSADLLVDRRTVNKEMVLGLLRGGNILSYRQMLQAFGIKVRDIAEEIALMDKVRRRQRGGMKVKFDRETSFRLRLIDVLDTVARDNSVSRAFIPKKERDSVCYYLASERESLVARGVITGTQAGIDVLDASLDFEARMSILASTRGSRVERLA